jgi:hypothetical protein
MKRHPEKLKIYREEAKDRHVSHWDWDYMTTAEIDAVMRQAAEHPCKDKNNNSFVTRILSLLPLPLQKRKSD